MTALEPIIERLTRRQTLRHHWIQSRYLRLLHAQDSLGIGLELREGYLHNRPDRTGNRLRNRLQHLWVIEQPTA